MTGSVRKLSIGVVAVLALMSLAVVVCRSGSSSSLSRYRSELRARGEKLTIADIAIPPSTNPAEVAGRQILDSNSFISNPSLVVNVMQFTAPGKARVAWRGELSLVTGYGATNVPARTWEDFIRQTKMSEPTLSILRGALENPPSDTGWAWKDDYQNLTNWRGRNFVRDRRIYQQLYNAEIAELHGGNLDAAIANLHAINGMARMNRNELTLVSQMIRIAIAQGGLSGTWEALQAPGWDEPRLASLQHDWERVNFIDGLERAFLGGRAFDEVLMAKLRNSSVRELAGFFPLWQSSVKSSWTSAGDFLRGVENSTAGRYVSMFSYKLTGMNADELVQLQFSSGDIDNLRLVKSGRPWAEVKPVVDKHYKEIDEKFGKDTFGRLKVSAISIPNLSASLRTEVRAETFRRLTITDIAIMRYQLKHGAAPKELGSLVPEFLASVPLDPMSGKPLCYRLNAEGTFTLYSTGEDGKDDGGDGTPRDGSQKFGLWEGKDAVWPTADVETNADAGPR
jgi:hypothetical protein